VYDDDILTMYCGLSAASHEKKKKCDVLHVIGCFGQNKKKCSDWLFRQKKNDDHDEGGSVVVLSMHCLSLIHANSQESCLFAAAVCSVCCIGVFRSYCFFKFGIMVLVMYISPHGEIMAEIGDRPKAAPRPKAVPPPLQTSASVGLREEYIVWQFKERGKWRDMSPQLTESIEYFEGGGSCGEVLAIDLVGTTPPARRIYDKITMTQQRQHMISGRGWVVVASKQIRRIFDDDEEVQ